MNIDIELPSASPRQTPSLHNSDEYKDDDTSLASVKLIDTVVDQQTTQIEKHETTPQVMKEDYLNSNIDQKEPSEDKIDDYSQKFEEDE